MVSIFGAIFLCIELVFPSGQPGSAAFARARALSLEPWHIEYQHACRAALTIIEARRDGL